MLGATDYYQRDDVAGVQIVPDNDHMTIDVPDMSIPWGPQSAPAWRYLDDEPWPYSVPPDSHAATDLQALRGSPVTEACRWEDDYWELFAGAGSDLPKDQVRIIGLGVLLAADPSLAAVLGLKVGDGLWRDGRSEWNVGKRRENSE